MIGVSVWATACKQLIPIDPKPLITVDSSMLDSISRQSDTMYVKPYKRTDFVTATYFISKKDSSVTQVMKDSTGKIRQVIIERKKRRIYAAEFYNNGQLMYTNTLDDYGQNHGEGKEFYPSGVLKRAGVYKHGFHWGKWKNYNEEGKYNLTEEYNEDGQSVKRYKE